MVLRLLPGKTYIIASVSLKKGCKGDTNLQLLGTNVTGINTEGVMSDTTEQHVTSSTLQGILVETKAVTTSNTTINIGGCIKGSTKQKKAEDKQKVAEVKS
jgi:hypothetical protein